MPVSKMEKNANNNSLKDNLNKRKKVSEFHDENNKKIKSMMNANHEYFTLNTGDKMPIVQFGTYQMKGDVCYEGVFSALKMGYKG